MIAKKVFAAVLSLCLLSASQSLASIEETFVLDSNGAGSISGNVFTLVSPGLVADGVTFTATLTVVGNGSTVSHNTNGLGVDGNTINPDEFLSFSLTTSAETGGSVVFDGFTSLDFNSFSGGVDHGVFSLDATLGNGDDTDLGAATLNEYSLPGSPVPQFTIFGTTGTPTTSFQLDDVTGRFTGTVDAGGGMIPEPASLLVWALLGATCLNRRRS